MDNAIAPTGPLDLERHMVTLADAYVAATDATISDLSRKITGDGTFFAKLKRDVGYSPRVSRARDVFVWFDENWPPDVVWPENIPRPCRAD